MTDHDTEDDPTRAWGKAFARAVFGKATDDDEVTVTSDPEPEPTDDQPGKPTGNFVPREGNIPKAKDDSDAQFVRDLFDN